MGRLLQNTDSTSE